MVGASILGKAAKVIEGASKTEKGAQLVAGVSKTGREIVQSEVGTAGKLFEGGKTIEPAAKQYVISEGKTAYFGKVHNQVYHAFRHIKEETHLSEQLVVQKIIKDLGANISQLSPGKGYRGVVKIEGVTLEYRAYEFIPGEINVGTILVK